jgi:O-antigen ligase/polysaccharide polymerase Wzy-like membrane protein
MATATPSTHPAALTEGAPGPNSAAENARLRSENRQAGALLLALIAACAYAAFAHGAVAIPEETRLQVGIAVVSVSAAASWLGWRGLSLSASREAWWGVGLLVAFAAWCTLSLLWSVMPDRTWGEVNRAISYALVLVLAMAVGSSARRAIERVAVGLLVVVVAVALYAFGGKALPGVNIHPLFDLNHASGIARLRAPLEYWNALALVCVFGVPIAVRIAADTKRRREARLVALAGTCMLIVVMGLTYSRGGFLALVAATILMTWLGGARLRGLAILAAAGTAAIPILSVAFTRPALTGNGVPLGPRITDGRVLLVMTIFCIGALLAAGIGLMRLERRVQWTKARSHAIWRALGITTAVVAVVALGGIAVSDRGPAGTVSDIARSFTETKQDPLTDPVRLVSTNSGNRWIWWKEAAGAFSDRPVGGYGAGSFPVVHLQYRTNRIPVAQPHSVPLQFLSETGFIGAALALGGLGALFVVAFGRVRRMPWGRERDLAVALFAGAVAWLVHGLVDWDWDFPGVTLPALLALGVLCALPATATATASPRGRVGPFGEPEPSGLGLRMVGLAAATLLLVSCMVSSALPAWSNSKSENAGIGVTSEPTPEQLERAAAQAELAARLDPLAVRPLFVASSIAQGRGRLLDSRQYLLQAVDRQPNNPETWLRLAALALQLADREGLRKAAHRALELDPYNIVAATLARRAEAYIAPPQLSATATGTPLPAAVAVAPVLQVPGLPTPPAAPGG